MTTVIRTFETFVVMPEIVVTPSRTQPMTDLAVSLLRALNVAYAGSEQVSFAYEASPEHKASHRNLASEGSHRRRVRVALHLDGSLEILELLR